MYIIDKKKKKNWTKSLPNVLLPIFEISRAEVNVWLFQEKNMIWNIHNFLMNSLTPFYISNYPALYTLDNMSPFICNIIWLADMTPV